MRHAGLQAIGVVAGGEAGLAAVVERRRDRLVAHLGPALDVGADVFVDAEDLLDDDHPTLARGEGGLVVGGELEAVGAGQLDRLGHGVSSP